jgi:2,4-dienoyl-CoA reductase-like NADH-dependent reductase (Old Yellow Enzyme family)/thioredoxin reductase
MRQFLIAAFFPERTGMRMLDELFKPITVGSLELKNRMIVPPMVTNFCTDEGVATERFINYHEARAMGGWSLMTIEQTVISKEAKGHPNQPGLWTNEQEDALSRLTLRIHAAGGKIGVQINHAGRSSRCEFTGAPLVSSSALKDPVVPDVPLELTVPEIEEIIHKFGLAAARAKKAGFDSITEHAHARYLIASFLSPIANKRADKYSGSLINRARFAREVLMCMRESVGPGFPIIYRFSADEYIEGGLTMGDTLALARIMEDAGADMLDVSVGNAFSPWYITQPAIVPHALIADLAEQFKKAVKIPVAVAGRINDPFIADTILSTGKADLVSMGRASIADPGFPNKVREGRFDDILYCIGCLQGCIESTRTYKPFKCLVNPVTGREGEYAATEGAQKKKVLVAGGGVSGLEAAVSAAQRGHDVTLCEKTGRLGGQWLLAAVPPGKAEYTNLVIWQKNQLEKLGAQVRLNTEVTPALIAAEKPDAVIVSTGSRPITPRIPGAGGPNVLQAIDVLGSRAVPGKRVAVVGGGLVGAETALHLAVQGIKVYLIEMFETIARDGCPTANHFLYENLAKYGVEAIVTATVTEIRDNSLIYTKEGVTSEIKELDNVILAVGARSDDPLSGALEGFGGKIIVIGDAKKARNALDGIREGFEAGMSV